MTVCTPNSGKWPALVKALDDFDKNGKIFDVLKKQIITGSVGAEEPIPKFFLEIYTGIVKRETIFHQVDAELKLNHELATKLELLPIESEVFFLMHYACYALDYKCRNFLLSPYKEISVLALGSILGRETRQETAEKIKQKICERPEVDCTVLENPSWMNCSNKSQQKSAYQEWCKDCSNLSGKA